MRDVLIHAYFGVDLAIVWETVQDRPPELREQVRFLLRNWPEAE